MTREEATKIIKECKEKGFKYTFYTVEEYHTALDMAIKALEQEPCEDAISRQAVEDKLLRLVNELEEIFADIREKNVDDSVCGLCEYDCDHGIDGSAFECPGFETDECFKLADKIRHEWQSTKDLPPVNPQPKTGHWIKLFLTDTSDIDGQCSECGFIHKFIDGHTTQYNFCPDCGARMIEPQETETWNGIHAPQITVPKGTFERIFNDADDDSDI